MCLLLFCETAVDLPLGHGDISGTLRHIQVVYSHSQWRYACMLLYKEERQRLPSEPTPTSIHPIINLNYLNGFCEPLLAAVSSPLL